MRESADEPAGSRRRGSRSPRLSGVGGRAGGRPGALPAGRPKPAGVDATGGRGRRCRARALARDAPGRRRPGPGGADRGRTGGDDRPASLAAGRSPVRAAGGGRDARGLGVRAAAGAGGRHRGGTGRGHAARHAGRRRAGGRPAARTRCAGRQPVDRPRQCVGRGRRDRPAARDAGRSSPPVRPRSALPGPGRRRPGASRASARARHRRPRPPVASTPAGFGRPAGRAPGLPPARLPTPERRGDRVPRRRDPARSSADSRTAAARPTRAVRYGTRQNGPCPEAIGPNSARQMPARANAVSNSAAP